MTTSILQSTPTVDRVRFANVWEDADILCDALSASCEGGRILSVASSGDNSLALLTVNPKEIVAADQCPSQLACVELRIAAFRNLNYYALLAFMGITECTTRNETYQELKNDLSDDAKQYWDAHTEDIQNGIIHAGRFERFLKMFARHVLPLIHSKETRNELLKAKTHLDRIEFYDNTWDNYIWRLLFKLFFNKMLWKKSGNEQDFFDHLPGNLSERVLWRTRHGLTELPTNTNPYLNYIIRGNYSMESLPRYLRAENKETITSRLDRITLTRATVQDAAIGQFDGFNLSDIFEPMENDEFNKCYAKLLSHANSGARLAYWNLLVPRYVPEAFEQRVNTNPELSEVLHWRDKTWFYQAFHVDEVY